ncbi:MAG: site-specific integrase [Notoacmeibacter sp.]|nr:site-specific integrase [Notoacmeibacter sp.]
MNMNLRRRKSIRVQRCDSTIAVSHLHAVQEFSIAELAEAYLRVLWDEGLHRKNVSAFLAEMDIILGSRRFHSFTEDMLDQVIGALRDRGNSNATINRKMAALSKLLRKARKMGNLVSLPEFRRQKERAGRIRFLEHDEEERLFSQMLAMNADAWRLSVFLVDTGARLGEAMALRWNDIQGHQATFWVTKSGRSGTVPLTHRALAAVENVRGTGRKGPFDRLTQQQYRTIWNLAKEQCGFGRDADVVPHILRHTCASRLVQGGIDIRRVQMWLGHRTLSVTMRYAHLATNDLDCCVSVLERTAGALK